jgi:heme-degrading monooxygenase HmoA
MFARTVTVRLKANMKADFQKTLENEIVPLLRKRQGFQDELTLVSQDGNEAVGVSLWDSKQNAESYQRETYPEVQKILTKVIDGAPQVKTYEVPYTTLTRTARGSGSA